MEQFENFLQRQFEIREIERNRFEFYRGCLSCCDDGTIIFDTKKKMLTLNEIDVVKQIATTRSGNQIADPDEIIRFRSAIEQLLFIGRISDPMLMRIASMMAT